MTDEEGYRKLFVVESRENHENIVNNLINLEDGSDEDAIDVIFRASHTLKGMAASMGFSEMERLCHSMEDVFQTIRTGELTVGPDLTDLLLACTDCIEEMLDDIESGGDASSCSSDDLINGLEKLANSADGACTENAEPSLPCYHLKVTVDPECDMKAVRAMLVLSNLSSLGQINSSTPTDEELDAGDFEGVLEIDIESDADEATLHRAASVTDISEVIIGPEGGDEADDLSDQPSADNESVQTTSDMPLFRVKVTVDPDCNMKDARAMIALQNLESLGNVLSSTPTMEQLDKGEFGGCLEVHVASDAGEEALRTAASGPDISEVLVEPGQVAGLPQVKSPAASDMVSPKKSEKRPKNKKTPGVINIRVDIHLLDQMMNLVEDLVINGGRLKQIAREYQIKEMDEALNMVSRSISDLQNLTMYIRMIPLSQIFNRFPRVVRDVAHHDGKEVEFIMKGGETELDRSVIDGLGDPLLHLIRNGVDHGLETPEERLKAGKPAKGTLILSARRDQGNVIIELSDDGAGIDREKILKKAIEKGITPQEGSENLTDDEVINFLFHAGFSTSETITDISGRGVGLDVVKSTIESLKGSIDVKTTLGKGSVFRLVLPPTMAIIEVMMVRINGRRCAIPVTAVVEVAKMDAESITRIGRSETLLLRDEVLQIHRLDAMFGGATSGDIVVIAQYHGSKCCIPVDIVEGQQEVVVKPVSNIVGNCRGVGGFTIPGDGDVVPILDVNTMV